MDKDNKPQKITKMQTIKDKVKDTTVAFVGAAKSAAKAVIIKQGTINSLALFDTNTIILRFFGHLF